MTTPIFTLLTSGSDPKIATREQLEEDINAIIQYLDNSRIAGDDANINGEYFAGPWDASIGRFPSARGENEDQGLVQNGDHYVVSTSGTVDGEFFEVGESIRALVTNPSTTDLSGNWYHSEIVPSLAPLTSRVDQIDIDLQDVSEANKIIYSDGNLVADTQIPERISDYAYIPASAPYYNVYATVDGPDPAKVIWRSTFVGARAGSYMEDCERIEAIGDGAMGASFYGERSTAIGSLALQWLGVKLGSGETLADWYHDLWLGTLPTDPTWDDDGLETNNPNVKDRIAAPNLATSRDDVKNNVAVGRDAALHLLRGTGNTATGKEALAHAYECSLNSAFGYKAGHDNLYGLGNSYFGTLAGEHNQDGAYGVYLGYGAGNGNVVGDRNIAVGYNAGDEIKTGNQNIFIGAFSGSQDKTDTGMTNRFYLQAAASTPFLTGNMSTGKLGLGVSSHSDLSQTEGFYTQRNGPLAGAPTLASGYKDIVVENGTGASGMTFLADDTAFSSINFGTVGAARAGGIFYSHNDDLLYHRANNVDQMAIGDGELVLFNIPTSAPASTNRVWNDGGTLKIT